MFRLFFVVFVTFTTCSSIAGLLTPIEITPDNARSLGFELTMDPHGSQKMRIVIFKFPYSVRKGWSAVRVQTHLLNLEGEQVAGSSVNTKIDEGNPSILAYYQPDIMDMTIHVHYFCNTGGDYECAEDYYVQSVSRYLMTK